MSVAQILIGALKLIDDDYDRMISTTTALLVATRGMWCSLSPRRSAVCPVDGRQFRLLEMSPTFWCTAELHVQGVDARELKRVPDALVQLRRIELASCRIDNGALATLLVGVCRAGTIRQVVLADYISIDDAVLMAFASVLARLETLELHDCFRVSDSGVHAHLHGMARLRVFLIGNAVTMTDDHLSAVLCESPLLESLKIWRSPRLSGAFLTRLHEVCYVSLRDVRIETCDAFDDEGVCHLAEFRGLETMNVANCLRVTALPLSLLPPLRTVVSGFLSWMIQLATLDLSTLVNVTRLGDFFLYGASALRTLDLAGLANVRTIGRSCLSGCYRLAAVDASALRHVADVGADFMADCSALQGLQLSGALLRHPAVDDVLKQKHAASAAASTAAASSSSVAAARSAARAASRVR